MYLGLNMSRRKAQVPTLADTLAKGFADLKAEEGEKQSQEEVVVTTEVLEEIPREPVIPLDYSGPTQHVAQQSSFVVTAKKPDQASEPDSEQPEPEKAKTLDRPSTTIGDDFDAEW